LAAWPHPLARLADISSEQGGLGSKVVVLKALAANAKTPFFAVLTQGFPRLVTVSRNALVAGDEGEAVPTGVRARVMLNEDAALLPDLEQVEQMIGEALAAAA
jgi:chemosensory pili system protein ChpC